MRIIIIIYVIIIYYYYYSHIFPDSRAQHCNYATLLAGRFEKKLNNNIQYSFYSAEPIYKVQILLYFPFFVG